jgi:hypothetical protein
MGELALVALEDVWRALETCAPGFRAEATMHHWVVYPPGGGAPYRRLPLGPHGRRDRVRIEAGHIRKMARQFEILDCMKSKIAGL